MPNEPKADWEKEARELAPKILPPEPLDAIGKQVWERTWLRNLTEALRKSHASGAREAEEKLAAEKRYSRDMLRATTLDIATRDGTILALEYKLRQTMVVVQAAQVVAAWSTEGTGRSPERLLAELREAVKKLEAALPSAPPSV